MVAVAYRSWSFARGSNCKALTGKILVFWIGGRLWEVVAYERWSHMDVRLQPYTWYKNTMMEPGRTKGTRYPKLTSENRCCVTETLETFGF